VTATTAAVVIVGNEVLSAKVQDENGPYLARRLHELGVELTALHCVPDRVDAIVETLLLERRRVGFVLTSGGVGPTHDDVTLGAVARALGVPLHRHPEMERVLREMHARHHRGAPLPDAALRMAELPEGTELLGDPEFPTLVASRVVMLPGVPSFLRHQFERVAHLFSGEPYRLVSLYLSLGEDHLALPLSAVAEAHPSVEIGSYPRFDAADHRVRVTIEGRDAQRVHDAARAILATLPPGAVVRSDGLPAGGT
jgi:molybdenum cofactor synthesis domain-containing protein